MRDPLDRTRYPIDPWRLIETAVPLDPRQAQTIFSLGNGFVGVRGGREETATEPACFVNGFFETWPIRYPEDAFGFAREGQTMQPAPDALRIQLRVAGEPPTRVETQRRELDMATGLLTRDTVWRTAAGPVRVRAQRLVSFTRRGLVAARIDVTPLEQPAPLQISHGLSCPRERTGDDGGLDPRRGTVLTGSTVETVAYRTNGDELLLGLRTARTGVRLICAVDHRLEQRAGVGSPIVTRSANAVQPETVWRTCVPAGHTARLTVLAWYELDQGGDTGLATLIDRATAQLRQARQDGWESLADQQRAWCQRAWADADVQVDDPGLQQAIRWNLFQAMQASARADGAGIAAKGVSGSGYDGHYFWDMETYVLPFLTYTAPDAARAAIGFRCGTLPQAKARAAELRLDGALFPWRTIDGREASAYFEAGTAQFHIDADIAHALTQYAAATGDDALLAGDGTTLLVETARMWASLGFFGDDGAFHVHGVTGPDEYSALVDDNVYTNLMAQANLRQAAAAVARWRPGDDGLAGEAATWRRIAHAMAVPYDKERGIHPQDADFLKHQRWDLAATPPGDFPLLLHHHPLTIYRHQVLKQADLVLAQILCPEAFTPAQKRANFDYYDPLTTGDSTLSAVPQAIGAAEAGHLDLAEEYLVKSAFVDLADTHRNADVGVHVAVAAGVWSALVFGFGGLRDASGRLSLFPALPDQWGRLCFSLLWRGTRLRVLITPGQVELSAQGGCPVPLTVWGSPVLVVPGQTRTLRQPW